MRVPSYFDAVLDVRVPLYFEYVLDVRVQFNFEYDQDVRVPFDLIPSSTYGFRESPEAVILSLLTELGLIFTYRVIALSFAVDVFHCVMQCI